MYGSFPNNNRQHFTGGTLISNSMGSHEDKGLPMKAHQRNHQEEENEKLPNEKEEFPCFSTAAQETILP